MESDSKRFVFVEAFDEKEEKNKIRVYERRADSYYIGHDLLIHGGNGVIESCHRVCYVKQNVYSAALVSMPCLISQSTRRAGGYQLHCHNDSSPLNAGGHPSKERSG